MTPQPHEPDINALVRILSSPASGKSPQSRLQLLACELSGCYGGITHKEQIGI